MVARIDTRTNPIADLMVVDDAIKMLGKVGHCGETIAETHIIQARYHLQRAADRIAPMCPAGWRGNRHGGPVESTRDISGSI